MKIHLLLFCLLFISSVSNAQKKAVTETGEEIILYEDGTWKYANDFREPKIAIKTHPIEFKKSSTSTFLLKSKQGDLGFYIDPKKWDFGKATSNKSAEYELTLKGESVQGVIINEDVEIPLESLKKIAIDNAKEASPDYHVIKEEYRVVNGLKVLYLQSEGTISGVKFYFRGYYYSNPTGTTQYLVVGYKNSMVKFQKEIEDLLNGLVIVQPKGSNALNSNDEKNSSDNIAQGAYSLNQNCKKYFDGKWEYEYMGKKVIVVRNLKTPPSI